jgi:hypothetical protein
MSVSNFSSTFSVVRTTSAFSTGTCSSSSARAQSSVSLIDGAFFRSSVRSACTNATSSRRSRASTPGTRTSMIRRSSAGSGKPM